MRAVTGDVVLGDAKDQFGCEVRREEIRDVEFGNDLIGGLQAGARHLVNRTPILRNDAKHAQADHPGFHASTTGALVYGVAAGRSAAPAVVAMLVIAVAAISNDIVGKILFIAKRPVFRSVRGERSHPIKSERRSRAALTR